jgi:oxygen-independent coproporphyrinogen-3 oxidase
MNCLAPASPAAPIGIYLHVPFCTHICPYCDFNTYAGQSDLIPAYVDALQRDLLREQTAIGRRQVASLFFGGGTPSLLAADQIAELIACAHGLFDLAPDAEITLEANPTGLTESYLRDLRTAGINRLSIGLQTTDHRGLRRLGRMHEAADADAAVANAVAAGFDRISLDLIFGWPGQTGESWERDLRTVLEWSDGAVSHLSLYSLIVEPGTPMADAVGRGIVTVPDDDAAADLYEQAIAMLGEAGWVHYEIANWARSAEQGSVHNRIYWRNGEYLGLGAGAHGRVGSIRTMRHLLPATYIRMLERGETAVSNAEEIDGPTAEGETMMLGLRLLEEGVGRQAFLERHGRSLDEAFGPVIEEHVRIGMIESADDRIRLTVRGMMLANDVCAAYLP